MSPEMPLPQPPAPPEWRTRSTTWLALTTLVFGAALLIGTLELGLRLAARSFRPEPIFIYPAAAWLGPLSALLIVAPAVVVGWWLGRLHTSVTARTLAIWVAAFLVTFDALLLVPRLHPLALAALAGGWAAVVTRIARTHPLLFDRILWRGTLVLVPLMAGLGLIAARTSTRPSVPAQTATPGAPNVLLLILDTVRAAELSSYGYERPTSPALDSLAAGGVLFERAVANASWTLPTHAAIFTGRFQHELSVGWSTPLDTVPPTLAEVFAEAGYATGGFIANLRYVAAEYGLARGFQTYRDYAPIASQLVGSTMLGRIAIGWYNRLGTQYVVAGRKDARRVVDEYLAWHAQAGGQPSFAFLNLFDAHDPYAPSAPYDLLFASEEPITRAIETGRPHSPEEIAGLRDAYDGAIAAMDAELGRLFRALRDRGALDRTIIIVTSDHGEEFGEDGHLGHGNDLQFPSLHVPLIIHWPGGGVPAGVNVPDPVSLADLPSTILDLAGLGRDGVLPGTSLRPLWGGEPFTSGTPILSELYWVPNQPESYPVARGDLHSLVRGRFQFISGPDGQEQLFDIIADPLGLKDLIDDPALADSVASLRRALAKFPLEDRAGR